MSAYTDIFNAATDAESPLRKQVATACQKAAADIFNEATNATNHANRISWARRVLLTGITGPMAMAENMIWKVLENAVIQASPATAVDSDVQFVVNSLIDTFANGI